MLLVLRWVISLWLLGWLVWPLSRRIFPNLPDSGLAAGRFLALALLTLLCFWGASLYILPLGLSPFIFFAVPLACACRTLSQPDARRDFATAVREQRRALIFSDAVFLLSFGAFLWIRARHPEINDLEKYMDSALMASLSRADFLPMQSPWFSGTPFTNYYYFGHMMAAMPARALATAPPLAYNFALPMFAAMFIAPLWSLCAALTGNSWRGFVAMSLVALLGHFEPLRQIFTTRQWWPLDWWQTSRVVPNTINEYPIFTLTIGDAHAHLFAFAVAALFFCLCFALFAEPTPTLVAPTLVAPQKLSHRRVVMLLIGALLGIIWMTNTWDLPLYALLFLFCATTSLALQRRRTRAAIEESQPVKEKRKAKSRGAVAVATHERSQAEAAQLVGGILLITEIVWLFVPLLMARLVAAPYLRHFKAQVSGAALDVWLPPIGSWLLLWGGMLTLGLLCLVIREREAVVAQRTFGLGLAICGLIALLAPQVFYIQGAFGGDLRHQDTVFKFGLQAWLLLGTAFGCGAVKKVMELRPAPRAAMAGVWALLWSVPVLCALCIVWTRAVRDAPRDGEGNFLLSLNGARHLPPSDERGIAWLRENARPDEAVLEAVGQSNEGNIGGDFSEYARVSALSGVAAPLGWPQHTMFWGSDWGEANRRWQMVRDVYAWPNDAASVDKLKQLNVRYVFVGDLEKRYGAAGLQRLRAFFEKQNAIAWQDGDTFIARVG